MKTATLQKDGRTVVAKVERLTTFAERSVGVLGRKSLGAGRGVYLRPCSAIHTFAVRFALDVFFLSREDRIVKVVRNLRPNRMAFGGLKAKAVLELEAGWLAEDALREGDVVTFAEGAERPGGPVNSS
ncbi:MAG: DUF192 domain-containing protein [Kiritimatiellae bacterium]|nr:DUF192 domain-containing protein [Kiritimatiellia bacterium]